MGARKMKKNLLFFVIWFFSIISGQESKDFDFDQEKQTCKVFNNEFPLGMCKDLIDFLKKAKEQLVDNSKKQDQLMPKAIFLNGGKNLKSNAAFFLSQISGIEYRQINFENIENFKDKSKFKTYLEKLWTEKKIDNLVSSQKIILALNNLNYLNKEFSEAVIEFFEEKIKKPNSNIAHNLLLFGTSFEGTQIPISLSKLFENSYTLKNSQKYIINNNKIIFDDKKCIIDDISYPNKICTQALRFLTAINEFKKK